MVLNIFIFENFSFRRTAEEDPRELKIAGKSGNLARDFWKNYSGWKGIFLERERRKNFLFFYFFYFFIFLFFYFFIFFGFGCLFAEGLPFLKVAEDTLED